MPALARRCFAGRRRFPSPAELASADTAKAREWVEVVREDEASLVGGLVEERASEIKQVERLAGVCASGCAELLRDVGDRPTPLPTNRLGTGRLPRRRQRRPRPHPHSPASSNPSSRPSASSARRLSTPPGRHLASRLRRRRRRRRLGPSTHGARRRVERRRSRRLSPPIGLWSRSQSFRGPGCPSC